MPCLRTSLAVFFSCAVALGASAADRPMTLVRSRNMSVIGQQPAKTLRGIARQLQEFRVVVGGLIANAERPLAQPTFVYVFGAEQEFAPFKPLYRGEPASMGGYLFHDDEVNDIALKLDAYDEGARIVFHEYAHLLLHGAARSIPLWLDEGLAESYSTYTLDAGGRGAAIGQPIVPHIALLRDRFVPLADVIAVDHESALYNERDRKSIFYAEVWALTHYLMTAVADGPMRIHRYATAIATGAEPAAAFNDAFGKTPAALEKDLRAYVRGVTFRSRVIVLKSRVEIEGPDEERVIPAAEAAAWLGDLQRRAGRAAEAAARIESAAAAAPNAPMAQLAKAWLRLEQKKPDEAWPAFERAAAVAPDDFTIHFAYGVALLRQEVDAGRYQGNTPVVDRARAALTRAAALNPVSSDVFAWLAYAEMLTDGRLTQAAAAIGRAMEMAPGRVDYVLRAADICILAGSLADARNMLHEVSRTTTDKVSATAAKTRLAELDTREAEARAAAAARSAIRDQEQRAIEGRSLASLPDGSAAVATDPEPGADRVADVPEPRLRPVRRGEERAYGELVEIECGASQVRVHLKVGRRVIIATANGMTDIAVKAFVPPNDAATTCGKNSSPPTVFLTWRTQPHRAEGALTIVGRAIALEFVPPGYTP